VNLDVRMSIVCHNGERTGRFGVPPSHTSQRKRETAEKTLERADSMIVGSKAVLRATRHGGRAGICQELAVFFVEMMSM